eukprot:157146-Prorocentrum_minimum.AAC.1
MYTTERLARVYMRKRSSRLHGSPARRAGRDHRQRGLYVRLRGGRSARHPFELGPQAVARGCFVGRRHRPRGDPALHG